MSRGEQKFRPYFSSKVLSRIITKMKMNPTPEDVGIIQYLETFAIKIERGVIQEAITLDPGIEQKLGFVSPAITISEEEFYRVWRSGFRMSPKQLKVAMDYAYRNDLMSPQEEEEYEIANGITS